MFVYRHENLEIPYEVANVRTDKRAGGKDTTEYSLTVRVFYDKVRQYRRPVRALRRKSISQLQQLGYKHEAGIPLQGESEDARKAEAREGIQCMFEGLVEKLKEDGLVN